MIPAHDEAVLLGEALESLAAQTRLADQVIVIADRCTDLTSQVAVAHGASPRLTIDNRDHKGGALNQVLASVLERLSDNDAVLVMDADTSLAPDFIAEATRRLREPKGPRAQVGAVGGIFLGFPLKGFIPHLQNNEYIRYAREIGRRKGRADVLTGTATLFSAKALRATEEARSRGQLPPGKGIYGIQSLTEDNELTLAFKHLGYRCVSPKGCISGTELMPTAARLAHQRLRWQRGALEDLRAYGMTHRTAPYLWRQILTYVAVGFVPFFTTALVFDWFSAHAIHWSWFWILVTGFVVFERIWSVKRGGWRSVLLAVLVVPEVLYDVFLHSVYVRALIDAVSGDRGTWDRAKPDTRKAPRLRGSRAKRFVRPAYAAALLAADVVLAYVCSAVGVAWAMIAVVVLAGAVLAALRLSGLDPFGRFLGSGEHATMNSSAGRSDRQGFGGLEVPSDALARRGGEGVHHCLSGAGNTRATARAIRQSRLATSAWLSASRGAQQLALSNGGRLGNSPTVLAPAQARHPSIERTKTWAET